MKLSQLVESGEVLHFVEASIPLRQGFPTAEEFDWINNFTQSAFGQTNGKLSAAGTGMGCREVQYQFPTKEDAEKAIWVVKAAARKAKLEIEIKYNPYVERNYDSDI